MAEATRVADLASNTALFNTLSGTRRRLQQFQTQIGTGKVSQTYQGLGRNTENLVDIENRNNLLKRYSQNNALIDVRLKITETAVGGIEKNIKDFRKQLATFNLGDKYKEQANKDIQAAAFRALQNIQTNLNEEADGRFLFSGGRSKVQPVNLNLSTLAAFQSTYDGNQVTYETTRDQQLQSFSLSQTTQATPDTTWLTFTRATGVITASNSEFSNVEVGSTITVSGTGSNDGTYTVSAVTGTSITVNTDMLTAETAGSAVITTVPTPDTAASTLVTAAASGGLTFDQAADTITAATANSLTSISVGDVIRVTGSISNNDEYIVTANTGTVLTVQKKKLTDEGGVGTEVVGTIASSSYYSGDNKSTSYRIDDTRAFDFETTAIDPAFEKAIRAMSIIAQGIFRSNGGLDQNQGRINDALYLLDSSTSLTTGGTPPYGPENDSNVGQIQLDLGYNRVLMDRTQKQNQSLITFFKTRISDVEDIDEAAVITRLLDDTRSLEASYQSLATIRSLSLVNFL